MKKRRPPIFPIAAILLVLGIVGSINMQMSQKAASQNPEDAPEAVGEAPRAQATDQRSAMAQSLEAKKDPASPRPEGPVAMTPEAPEKPASVKPSKPKMPETATSSQWYEDEAANR